MQRWLPHHGLSAGSGAMTASSGPANICHASSSLLLPFPAEPRSCWRMAKQEVDTKADAVIVLKLEPAN
jgi:hypothetical protein